MVEQTFQVGISTLVVGDAPGGQFSASFEDDGETGYFYALDLARTPEMILDAVHIYDVAKVVDRNQPSVLTIVWSCEGSKCALLINSYPHAVFDFTARRGYCRTNYPNFADPADGSWLTSDHRWSDGAIEWLALMGRP